MQLRNNAAAAQANAMMPVLQQYRDLLNDPEYQRLSAGYWSYIEPDASKPASAGLGCGANFRNLDAMMWVDAPNKPGDPATFMGMDVPAPKKPKQVQIAIHTKSDEGVSRLPAMNFRTGKDKDALGTLTIFAPDLASLLEGFEDKEEFTIELDVKRVYSLAYHDGHAMKAHMQRCDAARSNTQ